MKVVLDTNVVVSAVTADGPPSWLIEAARAGTLQVVLPDLVMEETIRVLTSKFEWTASQVRDVTVLLGALATSRPAAPAEAPGLTGDPADDRILACAADQGADVLVTGDRKHLLPLGEYERVRILTPQALLAELRAAE